MEGQYYACAIDRKSVDCSDTHLEARGNERRSSLTVQIPETHIQRPLSFSGPLQGVPSFTLGLRVAQKPKPIARQFRAHWFGAATGYQNIKQKKKKKTFAHLKKMYTFQSKITKSPVFFLSMRKRQQKISLKFLVSL